MRSKTYSGYRLLEDAPDLKMQSVIASEKECPVCRRKDYTTYRTASYKRMLTKGFQNTYHCHACGSEWEGNCYDKNFMPVKESLLKGSAIGNALKYIALVVLYLFVCAYAGGSFTSKVFLIIVNFIAFCGVSLASLLEYDKKAKLSLALKADAMIVGLIIQFFTIV